LEPVKFFEIFCVEGACLVCPGDRLDTPIHILANMAYRLSTVGRRSFPVAASMFWNTLPDDI